MSNYFAIELDGHIWNLMAPIKNLSVVGNPRVLQVSDPLTGTMLLSSKTAAPGSWLLTAGPRATPTGWIMGDALSVYLPTSVRRPDLPEPYELSKATSAAEVVSQIRTAMESRTEVGIPLASGPFLLNGATLPFAVVGLKPAP